MGDDWEDDEEEVDVDDDEDLGDDEEDEDDWEENEDDSMTDLQKAEAQVVVETVERLGAVEFKEIGAGVTVAVVPTKDGKQIQSIKKHLDEYRSTPERKKGTAVLHEPQSFIEHVNRMKDESTALFASVDPQKPSVTAVYDYHQLDHSPRFCEHRAIYPFPLAAEWKAWLARNGIRQAMDQKAFAEFLEDRMPDLCPSHLAGPRTAEYVSQLECSIAEPSQIISLARGLSVRVEQKLVNQVSLGSGETQMQWREEHKDVNGDALRVPGAFLIAIPIFVGGLSNVLPVRLRYRVRDGEVLWFYDLALVDVLFREAINAEIAKIHAGVERPIYVGSPEA